MAFEVALTPFSVMGATMSSAERNWLDWLESIVEQCYASDVPIYVKQDSGARPGKQGRIRDELWAHKEFPGAA